ncbi:hypothetical protein [Dysgonomonas sp. ZJ279]|uniref:hypothetical protein n=1 Tax=Dysgonomonas sp. ZJ279 TaxID=2709796 RepID=UPI0013ECDAC3|nr:hypothetical protein [Dysgonomonas sp. ZJ279]
MKNAVKSSIKWYLLSFVICCAAFIGIMAGREALLDKDGVITWAKVTGTHSETHYSGGRPRGSKVTKKYIDIVFQTKDETIEDQVKNEVGKVMAGDSIKIIYVATFPSIMEIHKDDNGNIDWKKVPRPKHTKFFGSSGK